MRTIDIKQLLLSGSNVEVAVFVPCSLCMGVGTYKQEYHGGPYGFGTVLDENCGRCFKDKRGRATGTEMVKLPLSSLVTAIKET